jgi:endo-alpha-1,4-polygalactosaminidase (GH114 family)
MGVFIYGYLNAGTLEKERPYYPIFKHLRLAPYDGWDGEFWIDPTDREWQQHLISEAKRMKRLGVIGLYLDNTDIYYMVTEGFRSPMKKAPTPQAVYTALSNIVLKLSDIGMIVMPNGGDTFVRKFVRAHPSVIRTVNQEGVLYQDKRRQSKEDTEYFTEYLDWCKKKGIYIRGIEYPKTKAQAVHAQLYYKKHGWQGIYISYHKDLRGD